MQEQIIVKFMAVTYLYRHLSTGCHPITLPSDGRMTDCSHGRCCLLSADRAPCLTRVSREVGKVRYNSLLHAPQYTDRFKQLEHFITVPYHMEGRGKGRKSESRGRGIHESCNPIRNPGVISPKPRPPILEKPALRFARSIILVRKKNSRFPTS